MPSRDYLIRQIEEMGVFLSILLRRILKMKEDGQEEQIETVVKESVLQELNLDINQIVVLENYEFLALVKRQFINEDQLEKLADILSVLGREIVHSYTLSKAAYLQKSLFLLVYIQENSMNFSFERRFKIHELQKLILQLGLKV